MAPRSSQPLASELSRTSPPPHARRSPVQRPSVQTPRRMRRMTSRTRDSAGLMARLVPLQFHRMTETLRKLVASQETGLVVVLVLVTATLTALAGSHPDRVTGEITNNFWNSYTLIQTGT